MSGEGSGACPEGHSPMETGSGDGRYPTGPPGKERSGTAVSNQRGRPFSPAIGGGAGRVRAGPSPIDGGRGAWLRREGRLPAAAAVPGARWLRRPLRTMAGLGRPGPGPRAALPAWKREILERKRAKLAALGGGAAPETGTEAGAAEPSEPAAERLVLAESLGPLRENPFMRLESERRRGTRRGGGEGPAGARPVQQLLELYRRVPGVRTIHADNILIIESAPGFPPAGPGPGPGSAARIRAAEVLVYEAPPPPGRVSRLLQKFDAPAAPVRRGSPERGRTPPPQPPPAPGPAAPRVGERAACFELERRDTGPGARLSDFLQKTGSNSFTVHPRGLHCSAGPRPLPNEPAAPESRAGAANGLAGSAPGLGERKPKVESGEPPVHPPPSPGTPSATPAASLALPTPNPANATPSQRQWVSAATSANDSFEIRPASKPDVDRIPAGDLQARALANLRVNSRNSFVFIPKRKDSGAPPPEVRQARGLPEREVDWASQRLELEAQLVPGRDSVPAGGRSPLGVEEGACPRPATALVDQAVRRQRLSSPSLYALPAAEAKPAQGLAVPSLAKNGKVPGRPGLPVTFIDEVDSEDEVPQEAKPPCSGAGGPPWYHLHPTGPGHPSGLQHRGGNTFTVVPKRKPGSLQANGEPGPQEAEDEEAGSLSEPPATLGTTLKKRYPTVHEIEVIGGYLALEKSCLTKAGSSRKKMKISFNDKRLQTTFEYPPESSLVQEEEAEAQEEAEEEDEEEEEESSSDGVLEKPFALFLPRATFVNSVGPESPRLPDGSSGLSSYTPKHSVAFNKWQEQTLEQTPSEVEPAPKEVMLTPAGQNDLSDFRSEPALYF
ncbi:taperin [Ursus arctos]|uniref:taperin n=1 Tax=Ursus arctos TaxID=9644 RepID=UPI0025473F98|nr:taperin [Ursus arctos]